MRGLHLVEDTHIFDLLEPKEQEVLVLEDEQGKTHLKGLSKVHVRSIEDFTQLGYFDENQDKQQATKASYTQQQPTARTGSSTRRTAGRMVCWAPTDFLIRALQDLRKMLDEGKELGMPDGVLINGKGPYRYNNSLVPTDIEHETISVYPVEGVHSGQPEAYEFKISDRFFRRLVDPPLDQVIAMLQKHKDES